MDSLRLKLESQGLRDVVYMVVNQQGDPAQRLHAVLAQRLPANITLYKQDEQQPDVWQTLSGQKDDFFIYDRCGRLTHHISLPYAIVGHGHIEGAIKDTYCKRICGDCTHESTETPEECTGTADAQPDAAPAAEEDTGHGHGHGHHHGHHHGDNHGVAHPHGHDHNRGHHHGHGHHGDNHGVAHPHGHDHNRGHHHGHHHVDHHGTHDNAGQQGVRQQGHEQAGVPQRQDRLDLGQMQQTVHIHQTP